MQPQHREYSFRYLSPEHFIDVFRRYYGPTHKLYASLSADKAAAFTAELTELIGKFNRAEDGTMVVPSKYLELVITRAG
jgi:hypothetical protein